ncbi:MAG TPA: hypothetical protein VNM67_05785 [Thermoanaerobaculia bacterium]|jgi:hypothetical protein|nr:hypothetical protein [Thermoanaerobaculia bacterium]
MGLNELPQFTIDERYESEGGHVRLVGRFSHLRGVQAGSGFLYSAAGPTLGDLVEIPQPGASATLLAEAWCISPELSPGKTFPWIDGYWQPYQIEMVLDPDHRWERRVFAAEPARSFEIEGATAWQPAGAPLPEGARDLGIREGAWDHEHCDLCFAHIGASGSPEGYVDAEERWLCVECHDKYAARQDISFACPPGK